MIYKLAAMPTPKTAAQTAQAIQNVFKTLAAADPDQKFSARLMVLGVEPKAFSATFLNPDGILDLYLLRRSFSSINTKFSKSEDLTEKAVRLEALDRLLTALRPLMPTSDHSLIDQILGKTASATRTTTPPKISVRFAPQAISLIEEEAAVALLEKKPRGHYILSSASGQGGVLVYIQTAKGVQTLEYKRDGFEFLVPTPEGHPRRFNFEDFQESINALIRKSGDTPINSSKKLDLA